ncbi:MAG: hypothetical protein QOK46_1147 [Microbacteriaceae bacterium]|jgi:uncharacterized membrane protein|nr:hypothetical protein [Microbacteriaceae bacterium]
MSRTDSPTRGPARPAPYVVSGVLLVIGIVMPLMVPLYARADPTFFGIPFFYWYQMLWVFIDALLLWIVYGIVIREDRRRRALIHGQASDDARRASDGSGDRS